MGVDHVPARPRSDAHGLVHDDANMDHFAGFDRLPDALALLCSSALCRLLGVRIECHHCTGTKTHMLIRLLLAVFFVAAVSMTIANAAGRWVAASDVIQIHVLNQPDLDTQVRVAPDGTISVSFVGRFRAAGLTEDVIAARIRKALTSAGILK